MRTSLARLERNRTDDAHQAIELLQHHFEELASAVLLAGRERGYLGGDPLGALQSLQTPHPMDLQVCIRVGELWQTFFDGFRPDEAQFEAARFETAASALNDQLGLLPDGSPPPTDLALAMLDALVQFWDERQQALSQRLDALIEDLGKNQQKIGSLDLQHAYQSDELQRSVALVAATLTELGEQVAGEESLSDLLTLLIRRLREELKHRGEEIARRRHELEERQQSERDFRRALSLAAGGKVPTGVHLDEGSAQVVEQVADVVAGHREQEGLIKQLEREKAQLLAELADKDLEIRNRDQLIARYEFGEADHGDEDRRLELYRQAIGIWESGADPSAIVARVREMERVLVLPEQERQQVMVLVDRHLESLAKTLGQLRKVIPLIEDPKRFRPRLLGSSPYDLKKLTGLMRAGRDAGRDLLAFVQRARWAAGAVLLARRLPRLRSIFQEMVRYVSDCRDKYGGPPAASLTIDLGTLDGLASLPATLAVDVQALAKTRGARLVLGEVLEIFSECVEEFHGLLQQARGEEIPRIEVPRREAASKGLERLAEELLELAGLLDSTFAEAKANGWKPTPQEESLVEQEHLMLHGLRDVDGLVGVLGDCAGAPVIGDHPRLPSGRRSDLDGLIRSIKARVRWLEDIARYRVERRD